MKLGNDWDTILNEQFSAEYYQKLAVFLNEEYSTQTIYPAKEDIFNALKQTSYQNTKVVILGQDPYHQPNQGHGYCFSVQKSVAIPPSLKNIYKELESDLGCIIPNHGNLVDWAKQGVLLLNTVLTVRAGQPNSHRNKGWELFTNFIITKLNEKDEPIVFLLWGRNAQQKEILITNPKHLVLKSVHPSPLSAYQGFLGCQHFSKTNQFLIENHQSPIDWQIK